jgi:hypothetical protein
MISKEELQNLYEKELKPKLAGIDGLRKSVIKRRLWGILFVLLPIVLFIPVSALLEGSFEGLPFLLLAPLGIVAIVFFVRAFNQKKKYVERFKNEVVREIVRAINPEWSYAPAQCITPSEYVQSELFQHPYDRYRGDDLIQGAIEKTDFRCSELHTEYKSVTHDKDGKQQETWHTIFKGLFFHADFNKNIQGKTFIEPDTAERLFGKFGQKLQASTKGRLVKLENPEFEKIFAVFSTDQIEARYILTPVMMEAIVNIYKIYKRPIYLSFNGSRVYIGISFSKALFEPRIMGKGVKYSDIEFMYQLFVMNATIVHELNLNTRIWTKE